MIINRKIPSSLLIIAAVIFLSGTFLWFYSDLRPEYPVAEKNIERNTLAASSIQASAQTGFSPDYPRIFNRTESNEVDELPGMIESLAKFPYISLSPRVPASIVTRLKAINPNIKVGRNFTAISITNNASGFPWSYDRDFYNKVSANDWWMHDVEGGTIINYGKITDQYYSLGINFTRYAPTDANGQRFYDWFPQFVYDRIVKGMSPDYLFNDEAYPAYSWIAGSSGNKPIDIDNDGVADSPDKIDEATTEGYRIMMTKLRQLLNSGGYGDMIIIGNGTNVGTTMPDLFNGAMREGFPYMHGQADPQPNSFMFNWKDNMFDPNFGYLTTEKLMKNPHFSEIAGESNWVEGNDRINAPNYPWFIQKVRFMLASTLLGDGYFGFAGLWNLSWWLPDYFTYNGKPGYLGTPESNYSQLTIITEGGQAASGKYGVYQRKFTKGLVLVNGSGYKQSVTVSGPYQKVPDGSAVSGPVEIPAWDALILVKTTCGEGKAVGACWCASETLSAGQWCCSGQKKAVCTANSDCSSGYTCSSPNTCQAQCTQIQKPSAAILPPAITKVSPAIISLANLNKGATTKITITGKNFSSGAKVKVNDVSATTVTFKKTTSLEAVIPLTLLKPGQASITVTNKDGGSIILADALTLTNVPSPVITISSPTDKTKIAANTVEITGKVNDPDATITIKVGAADQGFIAIDGSTGAFKKKVNLAVGKNTITMTAKNVMGTVTKTLTISNTYSAPVITISSPADKAKITANTVEVVGRVSDPDATVIIKVGAADQGSVEVNNSTGVFKKMVSLAIGKNTIMITSLNVMGTTTKTLTISNTLIIKTITPSNLDSDNDQLTDVEEALFTTDPKNPDTDGDGYLDGMEIKNRYSPRAGSNAKLKGTVLVKAYANPAYNYSVLYPSSWSAQTTTASKREIIFTAKTKEFVKILAEENPKSLSARAWFLTEFPGTDTSKITEITIGGLKGINNSLNDTIYLADGTMIYVLSYNFGTRTEANFKTTFVMISGSFTLNESTKSKPTITKVSPKTISLVNLKKGATAKITITGKNFSSGATIKVNNIKATKVTVKSATSIEAVVLLASLKPGLASVTVTNADKGSVTLTKAITLKGKKPTFNSADPKTLPAKKTGVGFLTLRGTNFLTGAKVLLDGKIAVTKTEILSSTRIKITINLSLIKQGKNYNLMIVNPDGQRATLSKAFRGK